MDEFNVKFKREKEKEMYFHQCAIEGKTDDDEEFIIGQGLATTKVLYISFKGERYSLDANDLVNAMLNTIEGKELNV